MARIFWVLALCVPLGRCSQSNCPAGYTETPKDIKNHDATEFSVSDIEGCKAKCDAAESCDSFEFNAEALGIKNCWTSTSGHDANVEQHVHWISCLKTAGTACDECFVGFDEAGGCDMLWKGDVLEAAKKLPDESCQRSECLPTAHAVCGMDLVDPNNATELEQVFERFSLDYNVTMKFDHFQSPIGFHGYSIVDVPNKFIEETFVFDTGVKQVFDIIKEEAGAEFPGIHPDATLTFKYRMNKNFSMSMEISQGMWPLPQIKSWWPQARQKICLSQCMDKLGEMAEAAYEAHEAEIKETGLPLPSDPSHTQEDLSALAHDAEGAEDKVAETVSKSLLSTGGLESEHVDADEDYIWDAAMTEVDKEFNAQEDFGHETPHGKAPFDLQMTNEDHATGIPQNMRLTINDGDFAGTVDVVISNMKTGNEVEGHWTTIAAYQQCGGIGFTGTGECVAGTTCKKNNEWYSGCQPEPGATPEEPKDTSICTPTQTFMDFFSEFKEIDESGEAQDRRLRRMEHGGLKLLTAETMSNVFKVMHRVAPKTRKLLPADATRLWNRDEIRAARIERSVRKKYHIVMGIPADTRTTVFVGSGLLIALVSFAAGLAVSKFSKHRHQPLTQSALLEE